MKSLLKYVSHHSLALGMAALLSAGASLAAQEGFGFERPELKFRYAYGAQAFDGLRPAAMGIGLCVPARVGAGELSLELGMFYKTGDAKLNVGSRIEDTRVAGLKPLDTFQSEDERRTRIEGLSLRLVYARPFVDSDLSWQAGLMIGGTKIRHQWNADIQSKDWSTMESTGTDANGNPIYPDSPADVWRDVYYGNTSDGFVGISPMAGLKWKVEDWSSLEVNVLLYNYRGLRLAHAAGQGTYSNPIGDGRPNRWDPYHKYMNFSENNFPKDRFEKSTRWVPHLEIGYSFRF